MSEEDYMSDSEDYYDDDDDMEGGGDQGTDDSENEMIDDDDDMNEGIKIEASKGKKKVYETDFECLSVPEVQKFVNKDAEHIVSIFGIDLGTATVLLRHLGWNKERLIEKYMDNPTSVNVAAGVAIAEPLESISSPRATSGSRPPQAPSRRTTRRSTLPSPSSQRGSTPQPFSGCPICCDENPTAVKSLSCNHSFCTECWGQYITAKVRGEGECNVRCMASDCSLVVSESFMKGVVPDDTIERYNELLLRDFVANMHNLKYCPAPSCVYTISCPSASKASLNKFVPIVTCAEGHSFCFGCNIDSDHRPIICSVAALWTKKCQDDSETANWIKSNTKECPKCQSTIEKNGGCNHMTCKKCKHEFCWVCMGPWSEHGSSWYNCNRYDEKGGVEARDAQSRSRASLERYLHYYNRWANHEQSAKLTSALYLQTEKKMEEMQVTSNLTWIEVQFAKKAVEELTRCRMTLKWTYAMAYYLDKDNQKEIFEDNQRDLEKAVEDLNELLEQPIDPESIATLRQKMTDKTVYVQKRNEILLEDTAQGFLDGRWRWNVTIPGFGEEDEE